MKSIDRLLAERRRRMYLWILGSIGFVPICFIALILGFPYAETHGRAVEILAGIALLLWVIATLSVILSNIGPNKNEIDTYRQHLATPTPQGMFDVLSARMNPLSIEEKAWVILYLTPLLGEITAADKEAFTGPHRLALHSHLTTCAAEFRWWNPTEMSEALRFQC